MIPNTIQVNQRVYPTTLLRILQLHADYECGSGNSGRCCGGWSIQVDGPEKGQIQDRLSAAGMEPP
jgi:hypothetical protein